MSNFWSSIRERAINIYPPFLGAGIHAHNVDKNTIRVKMKLTPLNKNVLGTHFSGSLYAMCDPWFVLILRRVLGTEYVVWDKATSIQFILPGRGTVTATFHIPQERIAKIRLEANGSQKIESTFAVDVMDEKGEAVAHAEKLLYVRMK